MDASPIELGAELRRLRYQLGFTQRQVAQRLGGHFVERDIQRIEAGYAGRLPLRQVETLLQVLGKDLHWLVSEQSLRMHAISSGPIPSADTMGSVPWSAEATLPDLVHARSRLQLAMQASHEAQQRSQELLHASHQLAEYWGRPRALEAPNAGSLTSAR